MKLNRTFHRCAAIETCCREEFASWDEWMKRVEEGKVSERITKADIKHLRRTLEARRVEMFSPETTGVPVKGKQLTFF